MASHEEIVSAVDRHIAEEFDSDRTVDNECVRTSRMLEQVVPYSSSQIGAALGKHPEMSRYRVERVGDVWKFVE